MEMVVAMCRLFCRLAVRNDDDGPPSIRLVYARTHWYDYEPYSVDVGLLWRSSLNTIVRPGMPRDDDTSTRPIRTYGLVVIKM
jgi:hypothetical protein